MKTSIALFLVTTVVAIPIVTAQVPADPVEPLIKQYRATTAELAKRREAGLKPQAEAYLEALEEASKLAEKGGSTLVMGAIERERKVVREAGELPKKAEADVPKQVLTARRKYVSAEAKVTKFLTPQEEAAKDRLTRDLDALERQAKLRKNEALLGRIAAEKKKLAGGPDTDAGFGKNLLRNADFTTGALGPGTPPEWDNHEGNASVEKEDGKVFVHLLGNGISQLVKLPPGTKKIHVALRLRAPNLDALPLPGAHRAGVHLYLEDAAGKLIASDDIEITRRERKWKPIDHETKVPDGASQVRLMLFREGVEGALDADSVTLEALER